MRSIAIVLCVLSAVFLVGCPDNTTKKTGTQTTIPNVPGEFKLYPKDPADHVEPVVINDERYGKPALTLLPGWSGEIKPEEYLTFKAATVIKDAGVFESEIKDSDLKLLGALTPLKHLRLYGCIHITDAGLKDLSALTALEYLDLSHCHELTDAGLKELKSLQSLKRLDLHYCPKFTTKGIADLKTSLPNAKIERMLNE